jgi:hypothetical protein
VNPGELVMDQQYLDQMRDFLTVIHDEFAILYDVVGAEGFGMDIEYKVTAQDQLIIKQARPWVSFWADVNGDYDLGITAIVEPQSSSSLGSNELVTVTVDNQGLNAMSNFDLELLVDGQSMELITIPQTIEAFSEANFQFSAPQDFSVVGDYSVTAMVSHEDDEYENNNTLNVVISKTYEVDAALSIEDLSVVCNDVVEVTTVIANQGDTTITDVQIEVVVNGSVVEIIDASVDIPFQEQETIIISVDSSLQQNNNITLNLLNVSPQSDGDSTNNSATATTNLESVYDVITLVINADNYPEETSWKLVNEFNEIVSTGSLDDDTEFYTEDICVDYSSCFSLYVYDSYGDGICCSWGEGNFQVLDSLGNTILINDGDFNNFAQEVFCLDNSECDITADINVLPATSSSANDGVITINTNSGISPFQYSIDGGQTLTDSNVFNNLPVGDFDVYIIGDSGLCIYEENISVEYCNFATVDIEATLVSSVVSTNGSIVITPTSGVGPYQYSIDGGQNFVTNNEFYNLAVGDYNIVVKDGADVCSYEVGVPIGVEGLVINEINYRSSVAFDPGDWIELYNPKAVTIDISNWQIKDDNSTHVFVLPEGTQIAGNGFLVIVKDEAAFSSVFPNIPFIGELDFGFGGSDAVRLYNPDSKLLDEVYYESEFPWPTCADETGKTLELITPDLDNSLPENWDCINENGSPNAVNSTGLSIEDVDSNSIALYPNPASNTLYILGNSVGYNIEVYSLVGQLVMTAPNTNQINVRSLNQGVYLIKISTETTTVTKRFIKF